MAIRRKASKKTRPADTCRLSVTIRGTCYGIRPVRPETSDVIRAWLLRKADGTTLVVADTIHGIGCECGDFAWRHEGRGTLCKHGRALRALGLFDDDGQDAHDWPAWTDTHAFTITR